MVVIFSFFFTFFLLLGEVLEGVCLNKSFDQIRFARLITKYQYKFAGWLKKPWGNLGDCFQGFAVENLFNEMGIPTSEVALVNRDEMDSYDGEQVIVPMQGYFGAGIPLDYNYKITPVFVGFHLPISSRKRFIKSSTVEKMKSKRQSVGCRDRQTAHFLKSLGINSYFSGCLTLTFPKRLKKPLHGKIFMVDVPSQYFKSIPDDLKENAIKISQVYYFKKAQIDNDEYEAFEEEARRQLSRFRDEARLVITSRVHVALPCTAMGIPVVFLCKKEGDDRLDLFQGILKVHKLGDVIDFNPAIPDIELVKELIKGGAIARISEVRSAVERKLGQ